MLPHRDFQSSNERPARQGRANRSVAVALYLNAVLLGAILVAVLAGKRGGGVDPLATPAFAQSVQPIAGGAGFYLMPAQLSEKVWGCYVMDVDAQTLLTYVYDRPPGAKDWQLRLAAARGFAFDRQLRNYNTSQPTPAEVQTLINLEHDAARRPEDLNPATRPTVPNQ